MPAAAQMPAFSIDGIAYPRSVLDRRVQQNLESAGQSIQAMRHPAALRKYQRAALVRLIDEMLLAREAENRGLQPDRPASEPGALPAWVDDEQRRRLLAALTRELATGIELDEAAIERVLLVGQRPQQSEQVRARHILLLVAEIGRAHV